MSVNGIHDAMGQLWYASSVYSPNRPATSAPVEPVEKAPAVEQGHKSQLYFAPPQLPEIREGADPVEMAVRGRIQYLTPDEVNSLMQKGTGSEDASSPLSPGAVAESKSPAQVMEEAECQTCKDRKYQDGSNDPGVSFKTPTKLTPEQAATAVRGHEMEHVVREQAKAEREDRRVVQQNVTLHTDICPECGEPFISGGVTRTVTKANPEPEMQPQQNQVSGFEAVA